ncbi:MAG: hypothetical protein KG003_11020 [Bacteroidetes bacterium]|nr:hypothetical protein [Bacteroidota bacterium]
MLQSNLEDSVKVRKCLDIYDKYYSPYSDSIVASNVFLSKAFTLAQKADYTSGILKTASLLAGNYVYLNNNAKALEYHFIVLKYAELANEKYYQGSSYFGIGLIYYSQRRWFESLDYFQQAEKSYEQSRESIKRSTPVYLTGVSLLELSRFAEAIKRFEKSYQYARVEKDSLRMHEIFLSLGKAYARMGMSSKAFPYLDKAESFYLINLEYEPLALIELERARLLFHQNNTTDALKHAIKAEEYAQKVHKQTILLEIPKTLYAIYKKIGDTEKALKYLKEYTDYRDTLLGLDIIAQIAVTKAKFEFQKTENTINQKLLENQKKKRRSNLVLIILCIVLAIGAIGFFSVRKERKKSEKLLLNILPESTARELKLYGHAVPKHHESVSIIFCDVEAFTTISEKLSAERLVNMLDHYFSGFDKIVADLGLEKIKTIGDSYMFASGLTSPNPEHAILAVQAALKILEYVRNSIIAMNEQYGVVFQFRVGVHSGDVVSGVVGYNKYAYDIWGDTVNVAARMEQNSEPGRINISSKTKALLNDKFKVVHRGKIHAKNKGELDMYFVMPPE